MRPAVALLAVLAVGVLAGAGAYLVGHAGGPDRQAAILAAERDGHRAGTIAGRRLGDVAGVSAGRSSGYRRTYRPAYGAARRTALDG